jgi:hypothetical protein
MTLCYKTIRSAARDTHTIDHRDRTRALRAAMRRSEKTFSTISTSELVALNRMIIQMLEAQNDNQQL